MSISNNYIPEKINDFNTYLDGNKMIGVADEYDELEQAHESTYGEFKAVRDDLHRLWKVKSCVDTAVRLPRCITKTWLDGRSGHQRR